MLEYTDISLVKALDIVLQRIINNFNGDWITAGYDIVNTNRIVFSNKLCYEKYQTVFEIESHNYEEIVIVLYGLCGLEIDENTIEMCEGDVSFVFSGHAHRELPIKGQDYLSVWMAIDLTRIRIHLSGKNSGDSFYNVNVYLLENDNECLVILDKIKQAFRNRRNYYPEMIKTYIFQFITFELLKIQKADCNIPNNVIWKEQIIEEIKDYIEKNYTRHIRLSDIASKICMSPNYLNVIFKSKTGKPIAQYIEDYKIIKAKELLKDSFSSIKDISYQLGYFDQYHFSKVFKKETGYSPDAFRKL